MSSRVIKNSVRVGRRAVKIEGHQIDLTIFLVVVTLMLFGVVMIFSSSYYHALNRFGDMYYFLKKQAMWSMFGFGAMLFMTRFKYDRLRRVAFMSYIFTIIGLILVLFTAEDANGSKRWLNLGFFSVQPSEVAKVSIILYMSTFVAWNNGVLKTFKGFLKCCTILVIPVTLIAIENLSTAIVVAFIGFSIMFVASPKIWYFVIMALPAAFGGAVMIMMPQFAYRFRRIKAWIDPFSDPTGIGFQTVQSLYAVASGGLFGLGLGQSRQKLGYIPEAYNDIIFSIICEELGLIGAASLLALFMVLIWRGIKIAMNTKDLFGCLIAFGIISMVSVQVLINIAVVTNTIPVTGMPLPFISYGGSSLAITMAAMGVLLNISKYSK